MKMDFDKIVIISLISFLILVGIIIAFNAEPVTIKMQRSCELIKMDYHYREGTNCIDKENNLHPIIFDCPAPYKWTNPECDMRFINQEVNE